MRQRRQQLDDRARWNIERLEPRCVLDSTVVFSEVMYNPHRSQEGYEFIELYNQNAIDMDLSSWSLANGVDYRFPKGTILPGGSYLVVAADPAALAAEGVPDALGPFTGRLSNGGETLELRDHNQRLMDELDYNDEGEWPVAADGAGPSLAKRGLNDASGPVANWTSSILIGGTPGRTNFGQVSGPPPEAVVQTVIARDALWQHRAELAPPPSDWNQLGFNASAWQGQSVANLIGYWPFDGNAAAAVGTNGQLVSSPLGTTDRNQAAGGALRFNGVNQSVSLPAGGGLDGATQGTISLWVQWNGLQDADCCGPTYGAVLGRQANGQFSDAILALDQADPAGAHLVWRHAGGPAPIAITGSQIVGDGQWHHIAIAFSAGHVELYLDGQLEGSANGVAPFGSSPTTPLSVGAWPSDGGGFATARIDDVAIWDGPLSVGQVTALAAQTTTPPTASPAAEASYFAGSAQVAGTTPAKATGVTVTASSAISGQKASSLVDGSGLSGDAHVSEPSTGTMWLSNGTFPGLTPDLNPELTFDLGTTQRIDTMRVWNYNHVDTPTCCLNRGLELADILVAGEDGEFHTLIDQQAFQQAPGTNSNFVQEIDLQNVEARYVKIDVDTSNGVANFGDVFSFVGLSEVQFLVNDLPGPTQLPLGPTTYYFRHEFDFNEAVARTDLSLSALLDDGAVVYLNGVEVYRHNMPGGPLAASTLASNPVGDATWLTGIPLPAASLRSGKNVLAVEVHQAAAADPDMLFAAELIATTRPLIVETLDALPIILNEVSAASDASLTVELKNIGTTPVDLSVLQIHLSNGYQAAIPAGTQLEPGAYYVFRAAKVLTGHQDGDRVRLVEPGRGHVLDSIEITTRHQARIPDGLGAVGLGADGLGEWMVANQTPGAVNTAPLHDEIVINEILYNHAPITAGSADPQSQYQEVGEEWIELYNRSDRSVDLTGWTFIDAIDFTFPAGVQLAAGAYVVVAKDPEALIAKYPALAGQIVGPYSGQLNNRTDQIVLRDEIGNLADKVRYHEDGQWPAAADGRGSSLELRDSDADNSLGLAWAASDEGRHSQWQTISYRGPAVRSPVGSDTRWNELVLGLLADGEVLLDDISVVQDPDGVAIQLIQNGSFDSDTLSAGADKWRLLGNHRHSEVIVDPADPTNQVLRFVATSATEHMHNHAETTFKTGDTFARITNGVEYEISYKAKWISGSNLLNSRLYFSRLAQTTAIPRPDRHGTPGARNSQQQDNLGPTYRGFIHHPAVPEPGQAVTVDVTANDADGVTGLDLRYAVSDGAWQTVAMTAVGGGKYTAQIPGQTASTIVQFYVEGRDSLGATTTFPRNGADSRALFKVNDGLAATNGLHNIRLILTPSDATFMHDTLELMSNDRIGATIIYDEGQIFYDAGVTLSGSQRARPYQPRLAFSVEFNSDQLFRGTHSTIILDRSESTGFGQRELLYRHGMNQSGDLPTQYNDLIHILAPRREHTGSAEVEMARYSDLYLDSQYEDGSSGQLYEYELVYYPTTTNDRTPEGRKLPQPDDVSGTAFRNLGPSKEDYRWTFLNKNNRNEDDYTRIMQFSAAMATPTATFNNVIGDVVDVDQWLRAFAFSTITGHGDNYGADGSQHNLQLYVRPSDNRVLFFPHDLDAFFEARRALVVNQDLRKFFRDPANEHMYYGHVHDMMQTTFNAEYMTYWTQHFGRLLPAQRFDRHLTDLVTRSTFLLGEIRRKSVEIPFAAAAGEVTTGEATATLTGTGWFNVRELRLAGSDQPLPTAWTSITAWSVDVEVPNGQSNVTLQAFDFQGELLGEVTVAVTSNRGDVTGDGVIDVADIDRVCAAARAGNEPLDLNGDHLTDVADVHYLVREILQTNLGDANLDRLFNSQDLVVVFQAGQYEDATLGNSGWAAGDWNCDGDFTTGDLVAAFQTANYTNAATASRSAATLAVDTGALASALDAAPSAVGLTELKTLADPTTQLSGQPAAIHPTFHALNALRHSNSSQAFDGQSAWQSLTKRGPREAARLNAATDEALAQLGFGADESPSPARRGTMRRRLLG